MLRLGLRFPKDLSDDCAGRSALPPPFWVLLLMLSTGSVVSSSMDALYTDTLVEW